ncbi:hypothetical protein [Halomarina rubra]|uniref:Uncharacterized protein n=1 Tax=Halomarina rubra TaxID=2071873 RepID=A0ABD6B202_9EURY|nr:hypothetical protein [Halomarina rubra]
MPSRRRFLYGLGSVSMLSLAGCSAPATFEVTNIEIQPGTAFTDISVTATSDTVFSIQEVVLRVTFSPERPAIYRVERSRTPEEGTEEVSDDWPIPEDQPFDDEYEFEIAAPGTSVAPASTQQYQLTAYDQDDTAVDQLSFKVSRVE